MASDDPLLTVGTDHDLYCSREDHVEVVGGVPFLIEILAHGHRPSGPECLENGKLGVIECGKRDGVVSQGRMVAHCFDLLDGGPTNSRVPQDVFPVSSSSFLLVLPRIELEGRSLLQR